MKGNAWSICWGIAAHLNVAALDAHRTAGVDVERSVQIEKALAINMGRSLARERARRGEPPDERGALSIRYSPR
jgi:hypothetical protein